VRPTPASSTMRPTTPTNRRAAPASTSAQSSRTPSRAGARKPQQQQRKQQAPAVVGSASDAEVTNFVQSVLEYAYLMDTYSICLQCVEKQR